jgi:DNA-binding NarL/FixJ family response regulator
MAPAPVQQAVRQEVSSEIISNEAWLYLRDSLRLSDREITIVQGVFDDEDTDDIAAVLGSSANFVYSSLQRIYRKLHIGSRAELVVRVMAEYWAFEADQPSW